MPSIRFAPGLLALLVLALSAPATAQNQTALINRTIAVLDTVCDGAPSDQDLVTLSCTISNNQGSLSGAEEAEAALQVSPREATGANSVATQTTSAQVETEKDRLEVAREEAARDAAGERRLGAFVNGFGGWGHVDQRGEEEDYDVSGGGLMAGMDYRITDSLVAGVGLGWGRQDTDYEKTPSVSGGGAQVGGGDIESESYTASLYGSFFQGPLHVDGVVTYTYVDYDFTRPVEIPGLAFANTASGDTDANQFGVSVGTGYDLHFGALSVGPTAQVSYLQTWIDGYREDGVPGVPLEYDDQDIKSLVTSLGGEMTYAISAPFGVVSPYVRGSWEHEFENDARNIDADLLLDDTGSGNLFSRTESPDRDYARVGGGVAAQFANGFAAFIDFDTIVGLSDVRYQRISGGGRIEF